LNNKVTANFIITEPTLITIPQQNQPFITDMLVMHATTLSAGDVTEEFYLTLTNGVTEQQLKNITVCPTATTTYT
jgi:hypothetical protein